MLDKSFFHFKQFTVKHHQSAMKVGFDGILLGAWCNVSGANRILDIGTGSGLIAIICAQKNLVAKIDAIEPDVLSYLEATDNFLNSAWSDRLTAYNLQLQLFGNSLKNKYDHIICNPPYFSNSVLPESKSRRNSKHTHTLTHEDLLEHAIMLLSTKAKFSLILPYFEGNIFIEKAGQSGFFLSRLTRMITKVKIERLLIELTNDKENSQSINDLIIYSESGQYTSEYIELVKDFYIKL